MILYPAMDIREGVVVRLREGDPDQQTTFSTNPVATAQRWIDAGAQWLHLVNLDGAFSQPNETLAILENIVKLGCRIQFAGGLRTRTDLDRARDAGAERLIIGTLAVKKPDILPDLLAIFGADALGIALDARDGQIAINGWQETTQLSPIAFGQQIAGLGFRHVLFTDIARDGGLHGVNAAATAALARATGLSVIASGGVSGADD